MTNRTDEDIIEQVKSLLESHVNPSVEQHGGNIEFISYKDGVLDLMLGGACSGCAGSTMTLKFGVENLIKHYIPEIKTINAEDDPFSRVDPYFAMDPFMENFDMYDREDENEPNTKEV